METANAKLSEVKSLPQRVRELAEQADKVAESKLPYSDARMYWKTFAEWLRQRQ